MPKGSGQLLSLRVLPPKTRVAYCQDCDLYVDEGQVGQRCPYRSCNYKLRSRVGYICPACECQNIFFRPSAYMSHRCEHYGP